MEAAVKAAAFGAAASVLLLLLKKHTPEIALLLAASACAVLCGMAFTLAQSVKAFLLSLQEQCSLSAAMLTPVFKCTASAVLSRLSSDLCREAGAPAVASAVETVAALCAVLVSLPLFTALLSLTEKML